MVNRKKLTDRIRELGLNQAAVAKAMGVAAPTISQKLSGVRPMTLDEAEQMAAVLKIDSAEFVSYFFYP